MIRILLTEFKRAVLGWRFIVTVAASSAIALIGGWNNIMVLRESGMPEQFGELSISAAVACMQTDVYLLVIPILCTVPFSDSFVEDFHSRFLRQYLPLTSRNRYLVSKTTVTMISGGFALCISQFIVLLVCTILLPIQGVELNEYSVTYTLFFLALSLVFVGSLPWPLAGGIAGAALKNRYMPYAAPFILFYVLSSFQARYFRSFYIFSPQEWIRPAHLELSAAYLCAAAAAAIAFAIYCFVMRKRLYEI